MERAEFTGRQRRGTVEAATHWHTRTHTHTGALEAADASLHSHPHPLPVSHRLLEGDHGNVVRGPTTRPLSPHPRTPPHVHTRGTLRTRWFHSRSTHVTSRRAPHGPSPPPHPPPLRPVSPYADHRSTSKEWVGGGWPHTWAPAHVARRKGRRQAAPLYINHHHREAWEFRRGGGTTSGPTPLTSRWATPSLPPPPASTAR